MKKLIVALCAVVMMAIFTVPAFAVVSPEATVIPETQPTTSSVTTDTNSTSPKTGSNDVALYAIIVLATAACGVATFKLAKSK